MYDLIIIGAGPIGLYGAILASLHGLKGIIIESQENIGGQLNLLYPEKDIIDIPGFNVIKAKEFINKLNEQYQSKENKLELKLSEEVLDINTFSMEVITNKAKYEAKCMILTTGMGVFTPRKLGLENEEKFSNIIYSLNDISQYKNKIVAILGGGDSALDWAIMLSKVASKVYIIHRREEFRGLESSVNKLDELGVIKLIPYKVISLNGIEKLEYLSLENIKDGSKINLFIDAAFVNYGLMPSSKQFSKIEYENGGIKVNEFCETNCQNIFAAGNIASYQGKIKNITSGFSEVIKSIKKISQIINPSKNTPAHF